MNTYELLSAAEPVDWKQIPTAALTHTYLQTPDSVKAWAQLALTEDALQLHLRLQVPKVRAQERGPLGMPCEDSCLEFFFCPVPGDKRYFNLEFNANGCLYLGMGTGLADLVRLVPDNPEELFSPQIHMTADGWELFYRIPHSFVRRFFPEYLPQKLSRANFYACSDLSEPAYYLSWSPIEGDPFTFHRAECFGFVEEKL